jgi:hypothetical protein
VPLGKHWVHHQHGSDCMELDTTYLLDELKHQLNEATKAYRHENALARFFYTVERLEKEQRLELSNEPEE